MRIDSLQKSKNTGACIALFAEDADITVDVTKVNALKILCRLEILKVYDVRDEDIIFLVNTALSMITNADRDEILKILESIDTSEPFLLITDTEGYGGKDKIIEVLYSDLLYHFEQFVKNDIVAKRRFIAMTLFIAQLLATYSYY